MNYFKQKYHMPGPKHNCFKIFCWLLAPVSQAPPVIVLQLVQIALQYNLYSETTQGKE